MIIFDRIFDPSSRDPISSIPVKKKSSVWISDFFEQKIKKYAKVTRVKGMSGYL